MKVALDRPIVHKIVPRCKYISGTPHWVLKCRFRRASLHRTMVVTATKRITYATKRIANKGFTLLCLKLLRALWVVVVLTQNL